MKGYGQYPALVEMMTPTPERREEDSVHVAKIPLRAELQSLLQAAQIYSERAAQLAGESARCLELARQAREVAKNLKECADL